MGSVKYQKVNVTLSAATFSSLAQAFPFNKPRVADHAIEAIRVAINTMYPPSTPEEWKDTSRYQGAGRHLLLVLYDMVWYLLRKLRSTKADPWRYGDHISEQPVAITLKIPIGLVKWIEKIARSRQITLPEATVFATEYGLRVLDSQGDSERMGERAREVWRDIFRAIWKRL